jgi:hypothetical protein
MRSADREIISSGDKSSGWGFPHPASNIHKIAKPSIKITRLLLSTTHSPLVSLA